MQELDYKKPTILIAGGGTAGHINPALAIAQALVRRRTDWQIIFCGSENGPEKNLVERQGFHFQAISAAPFEFTKPKMLLEAVQAFFRGKKQCSKLMGQYNVFATIGTGGYVAAPLMAAAKALNIPRILHEQNAHPGKATKVMSKGASCVCVSFPNTLESFPRAKKVVLTGNPIDEKFFQDMREDSRQVLGMSKKKRYVLVSGGSLGALTVNLAITDLVTILRRNPSATPYALHLVTGRKYFQEFKDKLRQYSDIVRVSDYIYNMPEEMAAADVVIGRAGAGTCAELAALGKASILIPYPYAKGDHQRKNAEALVSNGAAVLILDQDVSGQMLKQKLDEIFNDEHRLVRMSENARALAQAEAADLIVDELLLLTESAYE